MVCEEAAQLEGQKTHTEEQTVGRREQGHAPEPGWKPPPPVFSTLCKRCAAATKNGKGQREQKWQSAQTQKSLRSPRFSLPPQCPHQPLRHTQTQHTNRHTRKHTHAHKQTHTQTHTRTQTHTHTNKHKHTQKQHLVLRRAASTLANER